MTRTEMWRVERDATQTAYAPEAVPVLRVPSGTSLEFLTHDTRSPALLARPRAEPYDLRPPDRSRGNPRYAERRSAPLRRPATMMTSLRAVEAPWLSGFCASVSVAEGFAPAGAAHQ